MTDAWNATVVDRLPTGPTGGMCAAAPQILSAQVFQADGITPVPGLYSLGMRFQRRRRSHFVGGVGEDAAFIAAQVTGLADLARAA